MNFSETFWGVASILLATIQYIPYFKGIFSGRVKPHVFSWLVWALPAGITFLAQMSGDAGPGAWATGYTTFLCLAVLATSFSHGEKKIVPLDWITLVFALLAIVLWAVTKDPLGAVILATLANGLGFIPTVRKSIEKPFEEPLTSYAVSCLKWTCSVVALKSMTLTTLLFPVTSALMAVAFIIFALRRRAALNRRASRGALL